MIKPIISFIAILSLLPVAFAQTARRTSSDSSRLVQAAPESVGMSSERLANIDKAVLASIERKETPGAVVLVAHRGRVVYRKAFGDRAVEPKREQMTVDTIFDLASLTKVIATATSIMILVERGQVSLADPVARYIPEFGRFGKERVTVEQLLTHRAGFVPDNEIADYVGVSVNPMEQIYNLQLSYEPGTRFVYSDVGYIVAAELIRRVTGKQLDAFAKENIFTPLGMKDTFFSKDVIDLIAKQSHLRKAGLEYWADAISRIASTEQREGRWMRGEVHDPRSYELGGVAGHAGLFATADDVAVFCQMILNGGQYGSARVLAPYTIERMVSSHALPASQMRGLGWDVNTSFSSNRGDIWPVGTFGHTGFTGTSIWIDPASESFVVLLTNRVHPSGKGDVTRLRSFVASIVAGSITDISSSLAEKLNAPIYTDPPRVETPRAAIGRSVPSGPLHPVLTGIDVLQRDGFKQLEGRRIALITNHTGRDREGRSTVDVLAAAKNIKLVALFAPEHGLRGLEDTNVGDTRDEKTGLPVYSLYDKDRRRPTAEMLRDADTIVFDIQDIGARFYTYITTCAYAMEEAARRHLRFVVLDRPNPINGYDIEGPLADAELTAQPSFSFTSYHPIPVRYGMTIGELAMLFNKERNINADLQVIKMEGWRRADFFDGTTLTWVNPSPNMRSLTEALLYPGIGLLETTNLSVGRGTDTPFEIIGAPWMDGRKLAEELNLAGLAGVRFVPIRFTPRSSKFANEECSGVNIIITDRGSFRPVATGIHIAYQINRLHAGAWKVDDYLRLLVNRAVLAALKEGKSPSEIAAVWQADLAEFARIRRKYLIY
jgi:uncharacterized protein YbbC (DUF1343 family)/CubicO group peptidase (beta-lactamase class C family)